MRFRLLLLMLFCGAAAALAAPAAATVSGTVRGTDGKALAGVVVTNGLDACRTKDDGTWSLPRNPVSPFVSVVTPADRRIDRFYLPLTGNASGYDFTLKPAEKKTEFRFLHVSDIEVDKRGVRPAWLTILYEHIKAGNYDFLFSSGDLCKEEGIRFHVEKLGPEKTGIPLYTVIGNHDLDKVKKAPAEATYEKYLGPGYYAFEFGNVVVIATPMHGDGPARYYVAHHARFIRNLLALYPKDQPVLLFLHSLEHLCGTDLVVNPKGKSLDLRQYNVKGAFSGHSHTSDASLHGGKIPAFVTVSSRFGGCCGAPAAFRDVLVAADGTVTSELFYYQETPGFIGVCTPPAGTSRLLVTVLNPVKRTVAVEAVTKEGKRAALRRVTSSSWALDGELPAESGAVEVKYADDTVGKAEFRRPAVPAAELRPGAPWVTGTNTITRNTPPQLPTAAGELVPLWTAVVPANFEWGSPIVAEGLVFVAASDDGSRRGGGVYAFDAVTGEQKWFFRTGASVRNSPAYADGRVFFCDVENTVYAAAAKDGSLAWRSADPRLAHAVGACNAVLIAGGKVIAGNSDDLRAFDPADGREIWRYDPAAAKRRRAGCSSINQMTVAGKVLIVGVNWRGLKGMDLETGKELWFNNEFRLFHLGSGTVGPDGLLYFPARKFAALDPATGKTVRSGGMDPAKKWIINYHTSATPLILGDTIYSGSGGEGLVALDRETLKPKWMTGNCIKKEFLDIVPYRKWPGRTVATGAVLIGKVLWYGAVDGCLHGVDPATGKEVQKIELGAPLTGMIAVSGNLVYTTDFEGRLHAFTVK